MNNLLQELAKQAGFYANPDVEKFEKFAKLIVKECSKVAFRHDIAKFSRHGMDIGFEIEKHFDNDDQYRPFSGYGYNEDAWHAFQSGWNAAKKHFGDKQ